jgi:uncharacterized NAD(P)/FAD-binding protein YdhS
LQSLRRQQPWRKVVVARVAVAVMEKVAVTAARVIAEARAVRVAATAIKAARVAVMVRVDRAQVQVKDMDKVRVVAPIKATLTSINTSTNIVMVMVRVVVKEAACKERLSLHRLQHQSHQMAHKQLYLFS